jgi:hypothetical protein
MKPLNQKERSTLYWQFLILYVISIVLVICAMSFYYSVSNLSAEKLKKTEEEKAVLQQSVQKFKVKVHEVDSMLAMMDVQKESSSMETANITSALNDLKTISSTSPALDSLYRNIAVRYFSVYDDKLKIKTSGATIDAVKQLNSKLDQVTKDLDKCQTDYNNYITLHPN